MATSKVATWTVFIEIEEDDSLSGSYRLSPDTKISEVLDLWMDDFDILGHWVFVSASEEVIDGRKTLEMIGETAPRMIYLRAVKLSDGPMPRMTMEIFVYLNDKCHHLFVKPHEKLYRVVWQLPGNPKRLEYNGLPLNLQDTVQQAGLLNNSIIYESQCSIPVKLSSGVTVAVKLPSDSIVLNLEEKVSFYEKEEFALRCQGRCLRPEESIAQLEHAVEVSIAEFVVNVDGRRVTWRTKDEPISLPEFSSQLALKGNVDTKTVEMLEFVCAGCQRIIRNSQTNIQQLPVECCQMRSLTLNAVERSDSESNSEGSDATKLVQSLHDHLVEHRLKNSRTTASRCVCRDMKGKCAEERLDYNVLTRCNCNLLRRISELEEKMKELDTENKRLDTENKGLDAENKRMDTENKRLDAENKRLDAENKRLDTDNKRMDTENKRLDTENKLLDAENKRLDAENKRMDAENKRMDTENKRLDTGNKRLDADNKRMVTENRRLDAVNRRVDAENRRLDADNKRLDAENKRLTGENDTMYERLGVELLVGYLHDKFTPVSCPEVQSRGRLSWNDTISYIKCQVPGIRPGSVPVEEVIAVLQRLFTGRGLLTGWKIAGIGQRRGVVAGRQVAKATTRNEDEFLKNYKDSPFCDVDGAELSWEEAGKPLFQDIRTGGRVFICGGRRRTILDIFT